MNRNRNGIHHHLLEILLIISCVKLNANAYIHLYDFSYNRVNYNLTTVPPYINYNVQKLNLSMNNIENATFLSKNYPKLHMIDLSYNRIKNVKVDRCLTMKLHLRWNNIKELTRNISTCSSVMLLDLSHNDIENILNYTFNGNEMNLNYNKIKYINQTEMRNFRGLKLSISNNMINDIDENAFNGKSFISLDLSHNNLTYIKENAFNELSLIKLNLNHNRIKNLYPKSFNGLTVQQLDLNDNTLESLPDYVFSNLQSLTVLNLSFNKLHKLSYNCFSGLIRLTVLEITNNHLSKFDQEVFVNLMDMHKLNVNDNEYTDINIDKLIVMNKNFNSFNFHNNFLDCKTVHNICYNLTLNSITYTMGKHFNTTNFHGIPCLKYKIRLRSDITFKDFMRLTRQELNDLDMNVNKTKSVNEKIIHIKHVNDTINGKDAIVDEGITKLLTNTKTTEEILLEMHGTLKFVAVILGIVSFVLLTCIGIFIVQKFKMSTMFKYESFSRNDIQL